VKAFNVTSRIAALLQGLSRDAAFVSSRRPPASSQGDPIVQIGARFWRCVARLGKAVLPRVIRAPLEHALGQLAERHRVIDLSYARVLREAPLASLTDPRALAELLCVGGLNDELLEQFPLELLQYTGYGLRLWQYPNQFSRYLIEVGRRHVERYVEIGIRHGGSFVVTVEYLSRFASLSEAVAVDIDPVATLLPYPLAQPAVRLMQADTQTAKFAEWIQKQEPFDLAFIDGLHTFEACWSDFESLRSHARAIALHDIVNPLVPDVGRVWRAIKERYAASFDFLEFIDQYDSVTERSGHSHMGIGLAVACRRGTG
jgi:cephalosporin hydroxylase